MFKARSGYPFSGPFQPITIPFVLLALAACNNNPATTTTQTQSCPADCPVERCNILTYECNPAPSTEDEDVSEAPDSPPSDINDDAITSQGDQGEQPDEQREAEEEATEEDSEADETEEDVSESNDSDDDSQVHEGDTEEDEQSDSEVEDVDPDQPVGLCPDRLEPANPADAVPLHDGLLMADSALCGRELFDSLTANGCCDRGDCCNCGVESDLALCGFDDVDTYSFNLLAGDVAVVRIIADEPITRCRFWGELDIPGEAEARNSTCVPEDDLAMIRINPAVAREPTIVANYTLRVYSASEETIPYHLHIQIEPFSRSCTSDSWDDPWLTYNTLRGSEVACAHDDCTGYVTTRAENTAVEGQLCPWDARDYVVHKVVGDFPNSRVVRLRYDAAVSGMKATLYNTTGEALEEMCLSCDGTSGIAGDLEHRYELLGPGDHQLRITSDSPTPANFEVFFYDE